MRHRHPIVPLPLLRAIAAKVREISESHPDFVYPWDQGCRYYPTPNAPQGCIIGAAARECGYPLDSQKFNGETAVGALGYGGLGFDAVPPEMTWLREVQWQQDQGTPWAAAVAAADSLAAQ